MNTALSKQALNLGFATSGVMSSRSVMLPELGALLQAAHVGADTNSLQELVVEQDVLPGMGEPRISAAHNRDYLRSIGL